MTSIDQKDFSLTPIDYKSTDLEYTSQQKDLKKAVKGHRTVHSTTNELEVGFQKHSHTVHGTSIYQKDFSLTPIDYKSTDLEYTSQQKDLKKAVKGHRTVHSTTNELEVGSKKHSHTVHGTSIYQKGFSLTPIDYKSTDLEYTSQQKDLKKAVKGHRTVHSTTNELEVGSKNTHILCMGPPFTKKTSA